MQPHFSLLSRCCCSTEQPYREQDGSTDRYQDTDNLQASIISTFATVVIMWSMPITAAGTRAEAAIEGLLVMGVARAVLAEVV